MKKGQDPTEHCNGDPDEDPSNQIQDDRQRDGDLYRRICNFIGGCHSPNPTSHGGRDPSARCHQAVSQLLPAATVVCSPSEGADLQYIAFPKTKENWTYSQRNCSALGASLAGIDSEQEKRFLLRYKGKLDHWLGLWREQEQDQDQPWKWANGITFGLCETSSDSCIFAVC
uniref:C-type lectin domain-containing protein n=1 Tax=Chelonoidis abingdonii TaxID=106734 RepID=A0A8C0J1W8_CHEAB